MSSIKILIVNQPLLNRGDESAHRALVRKLISTFPDSQIRVLFYDVCQEFINSFVEKSANVRYVNIRPHVKGGRTWLLWTLRHRILWASLFHPSIIQLCLHYFWSSIVICAPGGMCMGGFQNWHHIALLSLAKLLRRKVFYFGRSIGPFPEITHNNKIFKQLSLELLRYFRFCSLRDAISQRYAELMNVKYSPTVDTAFLDHPNCELQSELKAKLGDSYVVFVPNSLCWHPSFRNVEMDRVMSFYDHVLKLYSSRFPGSKIVMMPQVFGTEDYLYCDRRFFEDIASRNPQFDITIVQDTYGSDIQQSIVSKARCLVGSRYHSVVFAINNNVPFVALNYEHKIAGLIEALDLHDCLVDITSAFTSETSQQEVFSAFAEKLACVERHDYARQKAWCMAERAYSDFVESINFSRRTSLADK